MSREFKINNDRGWTRISPIQPATQSYEASQQILADNQSDWLVILPKEEDLLSFSSEMNAWLGEKQKTLVFSPWDPAPWTRALPSTRSRMNRIHALNELSNSNPKKRIIITTLEGACQRTPPIQEWRKCLFHFKTGNSLKERDETRRQIEQLGYTKVDLVQDPGTYCVRGEVFDLFPAGAERPIRIEFFDSQIEKIRFFNPASQRSENELLDEAWVGPAHEIPNQSNLLEALSLKLKSTYDSRGVHRGLRDPLLSDLRNGILPENSDYLISWAYSNSCSLFENCKNFSVLWCHSSDSLSEFKNFIEMGLRAESENPEHKNLLPCIDELFDLSPFNVTQKAFTLEPFSQLDTPINIGAEIRSELLLSADGGREDAIIQSLIRNLESLQTVWVSATSESQLNRIKLFIDTRIDPTLARRCHTVIGPWTEGFKDQNRSFALHVENDFFPDHKKRSPLLKTNTPTRWMGLDALSDLRVNDAVVHRDHGVSIYRGIQRLSVAGIENEYLLLEYALKDKLYLPIYNISAIQKHHGDANPALDRLGNPLFQRAKEKAKESAQKLAFSLVKLYAKRSLATGFQFSKPDALFEKMADRFPYQETPDQLRAIDEIILDMTSGKIMDRVVCGDVGFGKTEVAIRAAFKAIEDGKQVAVLTPTTLLCFQHEQSFKSRLSDFGVKIESLSRFKTKKEQAVIINDIKNGKTDLVIGTHRILSKDIEFKDLGLLIIDEEHRFGVEHKEKIKSLSESIPVLTLTATPIPRTLHMAISGLRDISLIQTAPAERLPIKTYICSYNSELLSQAIQSELKRGGQVFFLHNRVSDLDKIANQIREWVPEARVVTGHGQMNESELEKTILQFYSKEANVLVCTTIIESGIDLPNANTIIINRADAFGLSQLYQIRGRVGRGGLRAFAYLVIPEENRITEDAKKRLAVIERFIELGSGFAIATHDLEIRGGGDLLGPEQSGHIAAVGLELYTELLEEAMKEIQTGEKTTNASKDPEIKVPFPCFIPEFYISEPHIRLSLYRKLSSCLNHQELNAAEIEIQDRFGRLPTEALNLIHLIQIKQMLKRHGIDGLTIGKDRATLQISNHSTINVGRAVAKASSYPESFQITSESKIAVKMTVTSLPALCQILQELLDDLAGNSVR